MNSKLLTVLLVHLCTPALSVAAPSELACKLFGAHGSAQMRTQSVSESGKVKTFLVFDKPIAWYADVLRFELVYSSGYDPKQPLVLVGNATGSNEIPQTVEITLAVPSLSTPSTRYGKVRSGDYLVDTWDGTIEKRKDYDIQCYNF